MPRLSLRIKLVVGVLLLLLPILGLLLASVRADYERQREMALGRQVQTAETIAALVDTVFDDSIDLGWALASDPAVRSFDPTTVDPHLQQLAARYPQYLDVEVFNAGGESVGASVVYRPGEARANVAEFPHFQQAMATGRPVVSNVVQAVRWGGRPVVVIAVPVLADGRSIGTVHLVFDLGQPPPRLAGIRLRPNDAFAVIDRQGRVAFHSLRPVLSWQERDGSQIPEVQAALAGRTVQTDDFRSPLVAGARAAGFVRSPRHGWVVFVSSPTAAVFAPIDEAIRRDLGLFALIALVGIAGTWLLSSYLVGPIDRLAALARALGRGELGRRADVRTGDELQELAETLNTMAARIQETVGRLQEAMGRFQAVFSSIDEAVYVFDPSSRLVEANAAGLALLGMGKEDLGRPLAEYLDRFDLRRLDGTPVRPEETTTARALRGETPPSYVGRFRNASGEERLANMSGAPVRDEQGRVILAVTVLRDITEERRRERARLALARVAQRIAATPDVEQALATAVNELVASFDIALARVWLWDEAEQALVLHASAGLSTRTAATGSQFGRFRLGERKIGAIAATRRPFLSNELLQQPWLADPAWARRERIVAFAGFPLLVADRLLGVIGLFSRRLFDEADLAMLGTVADQLAVAVENARLLARLRVALQLREEFIAAAAHELRTPITALKGYVGLLRRLPQAHPADWHKTLGVIERCTDRVARLARELVEAAELARGTLPLRRDRFDLAALARQVVAEAQTETTRFRYRLETAPANVVADRARIAEVIRHLLDNAVKYQAQGGNIDVTVGVANGEAVLTVRDYGVGIPAERQAHIFEPMYEPLAPGALGYVGVIGLGLPISKQIVERQGGRLWFESEPGRGSAFHVAFPAAER